MAIASRLKLNPDQIIHLTVDVDASREVVRWEGSAEWPVGTLNQIIEETGG